MSAIDSLKSAFIMVVILEELHFFKTRFYPLGSLGAHDGGVKTIVENNQLCINSIRRLSNWIAASRSAQLSLCRCIV